MGHVCSMSFMCTQCGQGTGVQHTRERERGGGEGGRLVGKGDVTNVF